MSSSGILVQLGGRRRFIVAKALMELGLLKVIHSDLLLAKREATALGQIPVIGSKFLSHLQNRVLPADFNIPMKRRTITFLFEQVQLWIKHDKKNSDMFALSDIVQSKVEESEIFSSSFVYAYDKASAIVLEKASAMGVSAILDQTIAPNDTMCSVFRREAEALDLPYSCFSEIELANIMREQERSWAVADVIICGSLFVKSELRKRGVKAPIFPVRPLFFNSQYSSMQYIRVWENSRPLRVLFVGYISFRKGVHLLIEAARQLGTKIECRFVGKIHEGDQPLLKGLPSNITLRGFRRGMDLMEEYKWADVFVLPSLWEGSAYAITEASSMGLPCVVTFSAGSWIKDGVDGFVLEEPRVDDLLACLNQLLDHPELLEQLSFNAIQSAVEYTWESYKEALSTAVCSV